MNFETVQNDIGIGELSDVVPYLARMLAEAMHADRCAVFVYSEDLKSTIVRFRYGYEETNLPAHAWADPVPPGWVPAEAYAIETRQPLQRTCPDDFERIPLLNPGQEVIEGRLADLTIPLIWNDHVQGTACIWRKDDPSIYSDAEVHRAVDLGRLVAMTIVFARQYERERGQRQRLDTLLQVASVTASEQGLDDVLQVLAGAVRSATDADICSLYVFDEHGDDVIAAFQDGMQDDEVQVFLDSKAIPVYEVPAEVRMRRTPEPIIIRDFQRDLAEDSSLCAYAIEHRISEMLLLPIAWQGEIVGAIYCWFRREDRRFSQAAIKTAEAIAQQAGGVVSRGRIEDGLRRQSMESEALLRIGQTVLASETIEPVLDQIAAVLKQLIPNNYAFVGLLTWNEEYIRVIREWGEDFRPILGAQIPLDASISGTAVRERRLITSTRVKDDPRAWQDIPGEKPLESVMVAPLRHENTVLGTLFLARDHQRGFTGREAQLMTLLSQQAAVAIGRVQAREDIARRARRQAFLARTGDLLVSSDNPEQNLEHIAEFGVGVIADGVLIGLSGWEYGSMRWVAGAFDDPEAADLLQLGLRDLERTTLQEQLEETLVSGQELAIAATEAEHPFLRGYMERLGLGLVRVIPLSQRERSPGVLVLLSRDTDASYREEDVQVGRIVAQRIGEALERQQINRNHEALLRVAEALHALSDTNELIRTIALELEQIIPCDQLIIADLDQKSEMLHTQVYRHRGMEVPGREYFPIDEGLCGEVVSHGRPIMDNHADLRATSVYGNQDERAFYRREGESAIATPVIVENEIIGVIFINRTGHGRFTMADYESFLLFAGLAGAALDRTILEEHNRELYRASTEVLAAVVDAKDPTTLRHSRNVAAYSRIIAGLLDLPTELIERIELAGLLHDIGKLGIPDRILSKPGPLTDDEFELVKTHPESGARILERHPALEDLLPMVRHHHEAFDGGGYPAGLSGDKIPIGASIICVADAFDTMTSERTYQRRRSVEGALAELERCAGTQFHPELVRRFVAHISEDDSPVRSSGASLSARVSREHIPADS